MFIVVDDTKFQQGQENLKLILVVQFTAGLEVSCSDSATFVVQFSRRIRKSFII